MALGGGTFTNMSKVLPGSYINFVSASKAQASVGNRGVVAIPMALNWGIDGEVFTVTRKEFEEGSMKDFGYLYNHDNLKALREVFRKANTVHICRVNSGDKATATEGSLTVTAKHSGVRGNDLLVKVTATANSSTVFDVATYLGGTLVDQQKAENIEALLASDFIKFTGTGALTANEGIALTGGTNKSTVQDSDYQTALNKLEAYSFNVLVCSSTTDTTKALFIAYTKRMRDESGVKFQTVVYKKKADHEGIISVDNALVGADNAAGLVYWTAGALAGCLVNKVITNMVYDGEYEVDVDYTQTELVDGIKEGSFLLHKVGSHLRVLEDINTFVSVSLEKGSDFSSNQTIRVIDEMSNTIGSVFKNRYLGKVQNNASGRTSFWNEVVTYMRKLEQIGAIEDFKAGDVKVEQGEDKKSIVVTNPVMPVSAMNKLYMTIVVK